MAKNNHKDTTKKLNILALYDYAKFDAIPGLAGGISYNELMEGEMC